MLILLLGKGGREHAFAHSLVKSPSAPKLVCATGSAALAQIATCIDIETPSEVYEWLIEHKPDLCIPGNEAWLVEGEGIAQICKEAGVPCWAPPKQTAQLEASKAFAKKFLLRHKIPTGEATYCSSYGEAVEAINKKYPVVLKYDGLAAGKGVAVCYEEEAAKDFLERVFLQEEFGSEDLLVEEFLQGSEISLFAAISNGNYHLFPPARDYKRRNNKDQGPNTGGMGAIAHKDLISFDLRCQIEKEIVVPTLEGLVKENLPYCGFLYFSLILTESGPKVLEYNCRFGDPECQAIFPLLKGDLAQYCLDAARGNLRPNLLDFSDNWSVAVVSSTGDYPNSAQKGAVITGLEGIEGVQVYHSGTQLSKEGVWETNGGRILTVVSQNKTRLDTVKQTYQETKKIKFEGQHYRTDIGLAHF